MTVVLTVSKEANSSKYGYKMATTAAKDILINDIMWNTSSAKADSIETAALLQHESDEALVQHPTRRLGRLKLHKMNSERWGQLSGLIGTNINFVACCLPCNL